MYVRANSFFARRKHNSSNLNLFIVRLALEFGCVVCFQVFDTDKSGYVDEVRAQSCDVLFGFATSCI